MISNNIYALASMCSQESPKKAKKTRKDGVLGRRKEMGDHAGKEEQERARGVPPRPPALRSHLLLIPKEAFKLRRNSKEEGQPRTALPGTLGGLWPSPVLPSPRRGPTLSGPPLLSPSGSVLATSSLLQLLPVGFGPILSLPQSR